MKYRNKKGRFVTKKHHSMQGKLQWYTLVGGMLWAITLGISHQPDTIEWARPAEASVDPALCDLTTVDCPNERQDTIDTAVRAVSDALGWEVTDETKQRIAYLYDKATEKCVTFTDAVKTVYCESQWMNVKSAIPGEESYGLSQIHLPSHKNITREQALDPNFALDFMVTNWNDAKWFGYSRDTKTCTNGLTINL